MYWYMYVVFAYVVTEQSYMYMYYVYNWFIWAKHLQNFHTVDVPEIWITMYILHMLQCTFSCASHEAYM